MGAAAAPAACVHSPTLLEVTGAELAAAPDALVAEAERLLPSLRKAEWIDRATAAERHP